MEKCGVPRVTAPSGAPSATLESERAASRNSSAESRRTSSGAAPPHAVAMSGASGVRPTAWKSATAPDEAAAAPSAFRSSSLVSPGSPTIAGTRAPQRRPTIWPTATATRSASQSCGIDTISTIARAARFSRQMQAVFGRAAGHGAAEVDEVAVAVGARADHRIGEDDRVRFPQAICAPNRGR